MRRGVAEASGRVRRVWHGNAVGLTSILERGQHFYSYYKAIVCRSWGACAWYRHHLACGCRPLQCKLSDDTITIL